MRALRYSEVRSAAATLVPPGCWIEVDGTKGALEWHQEEPNKMIVRTNGKPHQIYTRAGGPYLSETASASSRIAA